MIQLKKFITGKEVLETLNIKPFQLFELIEGGQLQVYNAAGRLKPPPYAQIRIDEHGDRKKTREDELEILKNTGPLLRLRDKYKSKKIWESKLSEGPIKGTFVYRDMLLAQADLDYCCILEGEIKKIKSEISNINRSWKGFELPESGATEILNYIVDSFYLKEEVRKQQRSSEKRVEANTEKAIFLCNPGTKWEDITIILTADNMVRIKMPQAENLFTYHELEMKDKRKGDQPTMLWELLKLFAKNNGFISSQNPKYDPKLPETAKRLNYHLKKLFGIDESIYTGHYKKEKGYRTRINFYNRTF